MRSRGFSVVELLFALAIGALLATALLPAFAEVLQRSRVDAATRRFATEIRETRARAVATGWEMRVVGYSASASDANANRFRVLGRRSTGIGWPAEDVEPFETDTQLATRWTNLDALYPGVEFNTGTARFEVTFDSRGAASDAGTSFNPMGIEGRGDHSKTINISVVGGVSIQ